MLADKGARTTVFMGEETALFVCFTEAIRVPVTR